jgi:hypothetical protein
MRAITAAFCSLVLAAWPGHVCAQSDLIGEEAFDLDLDLRASVTGGETGWLDEGFGKLRYGGDSAGTEARAEIASANVAWKPQLGFNFSGLVSFTWQPGLEENEAGLSEAYLKFRSNPAPTRFSARAGVFWPPVSQEHAGSNWQVTNSITPSAINTWIGEEVKVLGLEAQVETALGNHQLALTGAVFVHNDTSGTLLSYRGWTLHDVRMTTNAYLPLPPLSPGVAPYQDDETSPFWELDDRVGFYARADWTPPWPATFNAFYYDNRGDGISGRDMQTSWRTRFWNFGAMASLGERTVARSQVLFGNTSVGPDTPMGYPVDVDFTAAYLLITRELGPGNLSVRGDWFETNDNSYVDYDNNNENGWAAMLAYKAELTDFADLVVEVLHVSSDRAGRQLYGGIDADQEQTIVQSSLRFGL